MAITYPLDLLAGWPGWSTSFELLHRQEQSRSASGRTRVKDFGSPLWQATYTTRSLSPNDLDEWRARLDSMENGLQTFQGWQMSRYYPISFPRGDGLGDVSAVQIASINVNRKSITLKGAPVGFVLKPGDMLQLGPANLHRVQEAATTTGGVTSAFEIRPHLWPATAINDAVTVERPACTMAVVPGSITSTADLATGRGAVSFQAVEAR